MNDLDSQFVCVEEHHILLTMRCMVLLGQGVGDALSLVLRWGHNLLSNAHSCEIELFAAGRLYFACIVFLTRSKKSLSETWLCNSLSLFSICGAI